MKNILLRIERVLLFIFLLLIPTQLGRHFWPEWSYVLGIRIDYFSLTLYLIDLVWVGLFLILNLKFLIFKKLNNLNCFKKLGYLILLAIVNILIAESHWLAGYKWLRLGQFIWTVWYLKKNKEILKKFLIYIIPFWIILESLLDFGQLIKGGSLNGFFYWLGERRFNFNTVGIAQMAVSGRGFIRAYGTFSHPNSLAGFLLVSLMIWMKPSILRTSPLKRAIFWQWIILALGILGIILTGSRTVLVLGILYLVFIFLKPLCPAAARHLPLMKGRNKKNIFILLFLIILFFGFLFLIKNKNISGWDELGLEKRMDLNIAAWKVIKQNPLFGVGLGNFLVKLPKYQKTKLWLQPVHNIILLILSEVGILGLLIFSFQFSIFKKIKKIFFQKDKSFLWIFVIILVTGMADHYWLTLSQNIWLLAIVLALAIK